MTSGMKSTAATTPLLNLACCPPGVQAAVKRKWCMRRDLRSCTRPFCHGFAHRQPPHAPTCSEAFRVWVPRPRRRRLCCSEVCIGC